MALLAALALATLLAPEAEREPWRVAAARSAGGDALEVLAGRPALRGRIRRVAPLETHGGVARAPLALRPWLRVISPPASSGGVHLWARTLGEGAERGLPAASSGATLPRLCRALPAGPSELFAGPVGEAVELRLVLGEEPLRTLRPSVPPEDARPAPGVVDLAAQLAGETPAVLRLRAILRAQERFRAARIVDRNGDRDGEYGFLPELVDEGLLAGGDAGHDASGAADPGGPDGPPGGLIADGYRFRVWLPTYPDPESGAQLGVPLERAGRGRREIEPLLAARRFVVHAWPIDPGPHALRSFRMDESGTILVREPGAELHGHGSSAPDPVRATTADMRKVPAPAVDEGSRWHRVGPWAR